MAVEIKIQKPTGELSDAMKTVASIEAASLWINGHIAKEDWPRVHIVSDDGSVSFMPRVLN